MNYGILFSDSYFGHAVYNTFYMGALELIINIPLAFIAATMLNKIPKGDNVYKVFFLLPLVVSAVAIAIIFKFLFAPDPHSVANYFLSLVGLGPLGWFTNSSAARETMVIMSLWMKLGFNLIIFYAGLQSVPTELYEAATIDGANERQKWIYVTIPCMRNIFIFVYITSSIFVLRKFTEIYAIVGDYDSGPGDSLITIMLYIYRKAFATTAHTDIGVGSAACIVLFILILVITVINFILTERRQQK